MYAVIPTNDHGEWTYTNFETREQYVEFLWSCFKEPGKYNFDETSYLFNERARFFNENGVYTFLQPETKDYNSFFDKEKEKNRNGVIFKGKDTWFTTFDYYWLVNYCRIYNKEKKRFSFADVRDVQYHMALYEELAKHMKLHATELKKRQILSSYFHCAKIINYYWFEEGAIIKMAASLKAYLDGVDGIWPYLEEYANFLNTHTPWYRESHPGKVLNWIQQQEVEENGRIITIGNKSKIVGKVLDKDPTNGVGGPCLAKGTLVLMSNGELKKVEKLKKGDFVCGSDGYPKKVITTFNGISEMYKIQQTKGNAYTVTAEHSLYLWSHDKKRNIKVKAKDFNSLSNYQRTRKLSGIKFNGINFIEKELPIDPYYLGLYLGDGCKYDYSIIVNNDEDKEIVKYISDLCISENHVLKLKNKNKYRNDYNFEMVEMSLGVGSCRIPSILKKSYNSKFRKLKLHDKHIPKIYFKSSKEQRLKLIAGILDTDGYLNHKKARFEITLHNKRLSDDLIKLCILCGFDAHANKVESDGKKSTVNARKTNGIRINITGNIMLIPTLLQRKIANNNGIKNANRFSKLKVEHVGQGEYYGFECEDNLFVLEDGTITHNCTYFYHEEAGVAPKMDKTLEFLLPALKAGEEYTGQFCTAGTVGELKDCGPLKAIVYNPRSVDVLGIKTNLLDDRGTEGVCALFIPEQYGYIPYVDKFGNSLVEEALEAIKQERKQWEKDLTPSQYQLRVSQHPININEAFAYRDVSPWPVQIIESQIRRIEDKTYYEDYVDITKDENGNLQIIPSKKLPIREFPIKMNMLDKEGVICMYERPNKEIKWGDYYASIDPVMKGSTTTSESLCSIIVYKNRKEIKTVKANGEIEHILEPGKIVCTWCGRFDNLDRTHERLLNIIEIYQAWTIIENNITHFIAYCIEKRKQKFLVPRDQILFSKEIQASNNVYQEYGWRNYGDIFDSILLPYGIQFCKEELFVETNSDGDIIKVTFGVERIPDIMILKEALSHGEKNFDRLITFCSLAAFIKIQEANRGVQKETKYETKSTTPYENIKFPSPFKNIGKSSNFENLNIKRNAFKNLK